MSGPVHFIAHFTINDPDRYHEYEKAFFPVLKPHGGRFLTYDDDVLVVEGSRADGRTVIIEFESEDAWRGWWESPEYREIATIRQESTTAHSISVVHSPPAR